MNARRQTGYQGLRTQISADLHPHHLLSPCVELVGGACRARTRGPAHSTLMLASRMTFPIFSVSSAISLPNSAGEPASGVPPRSASCALKAGSASAALTARLSAAMASADVPLGAQAVPGAEFVPGQELAEGRNIRQHVRARRRRHAERPELARLDVGDRRGHGTEIDLHLACQQVAQRLHAAVRDVERFSKPEVGGSNPLGDPNDRSDPHTQAVPRPSESAVEGSPAATDARSARPNLTEGDIRSARKGSSSVRRRIAWGHQPLLRGLVRLSST